MLLRTLAQYRATLCLPKVKFSLGEFLACPHSQRQYLLLGFLYFSTVENEVSARQGRKQVSQSIMSVTLSFTLHIYYTIFFIKNQKGFLYGIKMVRQAGLEPTVPGLKVRCLDQLSYWRMFKKQDTIEKQF